jgi:hypothetical protein
MEISVRIGSFRPEMEEGKMYVTAGQFHLGTTALPLQLYEVIFLFLFLLLLPLLKNLQLSCPAPGSEVHLTLFPVFLAT